MNFSDINNLRKAGRLREAYQAAQTWMAEDPDSLWPRRAMGWVLFDYAKTNATHDRRQQFVKCLQQTATLALQANEDMFWDSLAWLVRAMVATEERHTSTRGLPLDTRFFDSLMLALEPLPIPRMSDACSALLQTMLRVKVEWGMFGRFCRWWHFDNLRPDDYKPFTTEQGRKILSLAERAFMAYSKNLLAYGTADDIAQWLPKLDALAKAHTEYIYLPYYQAKLLIHNGQSAAAADMLYTFVKCKPNDFWVWELLGDTAPDPQIQFCHYAKAALCRTKPEMLVALHEKLFNALYTRQQLPEAKAELEQTLAIRRKNKWKISDELMEAEQSEWYAQTTANPYMHVFYDPFAKKAETLVFGGKVQRREFVGKLKKTASGTAFVGDVFVPAKLAARVGKGKMVKGLAEASFDKKKGRYGWRAISLAVARPV